MIDQVASDPNFAASMDDTGVYERSFLEEIPAGDFIILTFEGDDLAASFAKIMKKLPAELAKFAKVVRRLEANAPPSPMPKRVFDSRA